MARRKTTRTDSSTRRSVRSSLVSAIVLVCGLFYLMTGMSQLLQPEWYFAHVGGFPPYNRLEIGLLGAVLLPLGVAMVIGSQNPTQNRMLIAVGASAATLAMLGFWYALSSGELTTEQGAGAAFALTVLSIPQLWAFWQVRPRLRR